MTKYQQKRGIKRRDGKGIGKGREGSGIVGELGSLLGIKLELNCFEKEDPLMESFSDRLKRKGWKIANYLY